MIVRKDIPGKIVGNHTYVHISALNHFSHEIRTQVSRAAELCHLDGSTDFNVVKFDTSLTTISFLDYTDFSESAFPILRQSWTTDCTRGVFRHRDYSDSLNPPILHRKELMLPPDYPRRDEFEALTAAADKIGLFDDTVRIGFLQGWQQLLSSKGFRVVGHMLIPIGNDESTSESDRNSGDSTVIARHLTALARYSFSAPVQSLARYGYLDGSRSVFDYGCGRGDDLRGLRELGIAAHGWDPYFAPQEPKLACDVVNLGFVINVIESLEERIETLRAAYALCRQLFVVSAMIRSDQSISGEAYGDGIVTSRGTFQKYFTQPELRQFISDVLDEEPMAVAPGIFYVFKDKEEEQRFQFGRVENRRKRLRMTSSSPPRPIPTSHTPRVSVPRLTAAERVQARYNQSKTLLEPVWRTWIDLGRPPAPEEIVELDSIVARFGSLNAALNLIRSSQKEEMPLVQASATARTNDLKVYLARLYFERRRTYHTLEARLQRDIKAFFGSFRVAQEAARELLASLTNVELIDSACRKAADRGQGWYLEGESLELHSSLVPQLPPLLRVYLECATILHGDVAASDLIKIHVGSAKLTLMRFDDFLGSPLPHMTQRIKINLRTQELEIFDYGGKHPPPYLYEKSRFINEEFPNYAEQIRVEESLGEIGLLKFPGHGPPAPQFDELLERRRYRIDGFSVKRHLTIPSLSARCGRYLTYADFIGAGETMRRLALDNVPREADTYNALVDLAEYVLDPVIDYFGMIRLTYGFSSAALAHKIPGRIAPTLDQHASHERRRNGDPICKRLGAACDFLVEHEDMKSVALWIAANTPFDRLYYYGMDRPIHVSFGPQHKREFIEMRAAANGRLIPRVRKNLPHTNSRIARG